MAKHPKESLAAALEALKMLTLPASEGKGKISSKALANGLDAEVDRLKELGYSMSEISGVLSAADVHLSPKELWRRKEGGKKKKKGGGAGELREDAKANQRVAEAAEAERAVDSENKPTMRPSAMGFRQRPTSDEL